MKREIRADEGLSLVIWLMKITGIWSRDVFTNQWQAFTYKCYSSIMHSFYIVNTTLMLLYLFLCAESREDFTEGFNLCISQTVVGAKVYPFIFRQRKIQSVISGLENNFFIDGSKHTSRQIPVIKTALTKGRILIYVVCALINGTSLVRIATPLTKELTSEKLETHKNTTRDRVFTYPMWYPFDVTETRYYVIAFTQQALYIAIEGLSIVSLPGLFYFLLILYTTAQFELLCVSLRNATEYVTIRLDEKRLNAEKETDIIENSDLASSEDSKELTVVTITSTKFEDRESILWLGTIKRDEISTTTGIRIQKRRKVPQICSPGRDLDTEMVNYLTECVRYHQSLLKYVCELNSLLSPIFFWEFAMGVLVICILGVNLITVPPNGIQFLNVVLHLASVTSMMWFISWFGSCLINQSTEVHNAAYECEWYDQSPRFKRLLKMIIMRAQKPATVNAGYFGSLSLPLFAKVMEMLYSYFAVLRQFRKE